MSCAATAWVWPRRWKACPWCRRPRSTCAWKGRARPRWSRRPPCARRSSTPRRQCRTVAGPSCARPAPSRSCVSPSKPTRPRSCSRHWMRWPPPCARPPPDSRTPAGPRRQPALPRSNPPMSARIPTFDITRFDTDREAFVAELGAAYREWGFAGISNHGISPELVDSAYAAFQKFFALPEEVKKQYHVPGGGGARGYTPFGVETAKGSKHFDLKEFWHIGREI